MSAENSHEGFLHTDKATTRLPCQIPLESPKMNARHLVCVCWPPPEVGPDILATRGWTLQELILPSRVLHYSAEQMVWDCESRIREDGLSPTITGNPASLIRSALQSNKALASSAHTQWYAIVENYTSRSLTEGTDKLPAISGLAMELQRRTGDEYLAGLWRNDLVAGLMWAPSEKRKLNRMSWYRAPSWSWAAYDGAISYKATIEDNEQEFELEILEVMVEYAGLSPFGAVKAGFLRVSCFLKETKLGKRNVFDLYDFKDQQGSFCPDDAEDPENSHIWCMKVTTSDYIGASTVHMYPYGVALQPTGNLQNEFERVGTFELRRCEDWFSDSDKVTITIV